MLRVIDADPVTHQEAVRGLMAEYLTWLNEKLQIHYGYAFDVAAVVDDNMGNLAQFLPPQGVMLLAGAGEEFAGMACLRRLDSAACEVKRVFVRPAYRGQGIGRALVQ